MMVRGPGASQGRRQKSPWNAELRERGRTWNTEIAAARLPNAQTRDEGGGRGRERRFPGHGGFQINLTSGAWYSHAEAKGGYSPFSLLKFIDEHMQPDTPFADDDERIAWLVVFLQNHPGTGPCNGSVDDAEGTAAAGASRIQAERTERALVPLDHPKATPCREYLASRRIPIPQPLPEWYSQVVGYLPNARVGEGAIVGILRANQRTVAYSLRFIDALGQKSAFEPCFARYNLEPANGLLEFPGGPGAAPDETIIAEGVEDALSIRRISDQPIVGLVAVGSWRDLPPIPGKILVVRHGDAADSAADKALRKGIDRQIFAGRVRPEIRCTPTAPDEDANSILQTGGEGALAAVLDDARAREPEQPSYTAEVEWLATLTLQEFDHLRHEVARRHKVQLKTLKTDVDAARKRGQQAPNSQADMLVALGNQADLFHTADRKAYAAVALSTRSETFEIGSAEFAYWLRHEFYRATNGGAPNRESVTTAVDALHARALFDGPEHRVFLRTARLGDTIYLDLADDAGRVVEVTANGWQVLDQAPIRFIRPGTMRPLPTPVHVHVPEHGSKIDVLREFVAVTDAGFVLLVGFMLNAMRGEGPYYAAIVLGEQGTAKSSTCRVVRGLVDPAAPMLLAPVKSEENLFVEAATTHLMGFDNFSSLTDLMSDALCRLATGGGFSKRQLYTTAGKYSVEVTRPLIINGITNVVARADLADRALFFTLEYISDDKRLDERKLFADFEDRRPEILGALLDGLVTGLKRADTVVLTKLPRMADCMRWAVACETEFWREGTFQRAFETTAYEATYAILEASPLGEALRLFMADRDDWHGTSASLLDALAPFAGDAVRRREEWPLPNKLRGKLREVAAPLRKLGITYRHDRAGDAAGTRLIHVEKRERDIPPKSQAKGSSEPSVSSEERNRGDHPAHPVTNYSVSSESSERKSSKKTNGMGKSPGNGSDRFSDGPDGSDDPLGQLLGRTPLSHSVAGRLDLIRAFAAENPNRSPAWLAKQLGQPEGKVREALDLPPKTAKAKASSGESAP